MRSRAAYHPTSNHNWVQSDKPSDLVAETVWYIRDPSQIRTERRYLENAEYSE